MAHNRKSRYYAEPGETFDTWRAKHFNADGVSLETGESYEEARLQSMYWFRTQRFTKVVHPRIMQLRQYPALSRA